jgi:4-hydroxy-4-methyl-2-oxoglutarate aldolase
MTVTIHSVPAPLLTAEEIEPWRRVPVAVAVDLVPDEQIDPALRPLNPPGKQPPLFGRAVTDRGERGETGEEGSARR